MRTRAERWSEGRVGGGAKDVPLFLVTAVDDGPAPTFPQVRRAWLASAEYLGVGRRDRPHLSLIHI